MTVTTLGRRSRTTPTVIWSSALLTGAALATGRPDPPAGGVVACGAGRETRYVAAAPPEIPPMRTPTRRSAAARPPFTLELPARNPRCFPVRARDRFSAP